MPISSENIKQDLDQLTNEQLQQVADFIAFLKFRDRRHRSTALHVKQLAALVRKYAEEDRALAEAEIDDNAAMLQQEDE